METKELKVYLKHAVDLESAIYTCVQIISKLNLELRKPPVVHKVPEPEFPQKPMPARPIFPMRPNKPEPPKTNASKAKVEVPKKISIKWEIVGIAYMILCGIGGIFGSFYSQYAGITCAFAVGVSTVISLPMVRSINKKLAAQKKKRRSINKIFEISI